MRYVHGGNVMRAAQLYGLDPTLIIDFSANINLLGPPKAAIDAITANLERVSQYPDPDCSELRAALGRYFGLDPAHLILGNGASEVICLVVNAGRPRRAGVLVPTFSEYEHALEAAGSEIARFALSSKNGFLPDADELARQITGIDMLFVCNPNNPSGSVFRPEDFLRILYVAVERGIVVVVDEAFMDFVDDGESITLRREAVSREGLFVIGSLTKFFALPGLRVGYGVGSASFVERLWQLRDPWSVNALAQVAAVASMADSRFIAKTKEWVRSERAFLFNELARLPGLKVYPPSANYILADIRDTGVTAPHLCQVLGRKGILVRDCGDYPFLDAYYVRFAVRTREQNRILLAALEEALL